jgi:hypothetical protein
MILNRISLPLVLAAVTICSSLRAQVAVGQWREHMPYAKGLRVAVTPDRIYHVGEHGLYYFDRGADALERLSKINGMSDFGFSAIAYSDQHNTLVIAYSNTNIDLIKDNQIINIPDIKDKQILGNKTINNIHIDGDYAYLACGFAIVVLDLVREEVKDTWYIGANGGPVVVNDVASNPDHFVAATATGLLMAPRNGVLLADYNNWTLNNQIPQQAYSSVTEMEGRFYASLQNGLSDTIYYQEQLGSAWVRFPDPVIYNLNSLESTDDRLVVCMDGKVEIYDNLNARLFGTTSFGDYDAHPVHGSPDAAGNVWVADDELGLCELRPDYSSKAYPLGGPGDVSSFDMDVWDSRLYVAGGGYSGAWGPEYSTVGIFSFIDGQWTTTRPGSGLLQNMWDFVRVKVDPFDSRRMYACSWGAGLVEFYDGQPVARYDTTNSAITAIVGYPGNYRLGGMAIDDNANLWVGGTDSGKMLFCKTAGGSWYGYSFPGVVTSGSVANMTVDQTGQVWAIIPRNNGLLVFNHNGTLSETGDDQSRKLTSAVGNGALASNNLFCIATDLDGEVWVGSDNGISVFYSPSSVFSGSSFDSQQIIIEQDGYVQYVLENQAVTVIKVDGANRKWVGTSSSGVYLLSADGTEEIHHFTVENSPLPSNGITALTIDHLTGEVYIGTEKGIVSYRGTATYGEPTIDGTKVYAYPNPVRPEYFGPIAIKGLTRDADVKITDVSGNVVYATRAYGGQAVWDGNNLSGQSARSGVYLVFASDEDGTETVVTKIMFVR